MDVEVETLDRFERLTSSLVWEEKDWELKKISDWTKYFKRRRFIMSADKEILKLMIEKRKVN